MRLAGLHEDCLNLLSVDCGVDRPLAEHSHGRRVRPDRRTGDGEPSELCRRIEGCDRAIGLVRHDSDFRGHHGRDRVLNLAVGARTGRRWRIGADRLGFGQSQRRKGARAERTTGRRERDDNGDGAGDPGNQSRLRSHDIER